MKDLPAAADLDRAKIARVVSAIVREMGFELPDGHGLEGVTIATTHDKIDDVYDVRLRFDVAFLAELPRRKEGEDDAEFDRHSLSPTDAVTDVLHELCRRGLLRRP
jgi:hypothetical protein